MRKIIIHSKSDTLSHKELWKIMTTLEDYPKWCKFCKSIISSEIKEGEIFYDTTTLLWVPLKIKHTITKIKPYEEIQYFLELPGKGKMWHKFTLQQKDKETHLISEVSFDLGNRLRNATVGHILEKRWVELIKQGCPGLTMIKRVQ